MMGLLNDKGTKTANKKIEVVKNHYLSPNQIKPN